MNERRQRTILLTVNGQDYEHTAATRRTLADFLRQDLRLTGTHIGCEHGVCGACTVLVNGAPVRSCLMLAVQAAGATIETVEGLAPDANTLHPLQQAFQHCHALQCGFCTPGFLLTMKAAIEANPSPTAAEMQTAIAGSLCRCGGYQTIVEAGLMAAAQLRGEDA